MTKTQTTVDWFGYAQTYDLLMAHNPFYQQLHQELKGRISSWKISAGDRILDLGAGTGNYSIELAKIFPQAEVLHIEPNPGMNQIAQQKKEKWDLANLKIISSGVQQLELAPNSIQACICIHALYTFPKPMEVLRHIYKWTKINGIGLFVDPGRQVNVLDWQFAIGWRLIKTYGIKKTIELMKKGREISHHNRQIRKAQPQGVYWLHDHDEFCEAVENAGFKVIDSRYCFRKISDMVITRK